MADLAVKFLIQPQLDIAGIKKISEQAKANISGTFKDLKIIDGASTTSAFSQIQSQAQTTAQSVGAIGNAGATAGATLQSGIGGSINSITNKIKTDLPKGIGEAASKAASAMSDALSTGLAVAGGGLLLKGIDGIIGGFEKLFEKGLAVQKTQNELRIGFASAGVASEDLDKTLKNNGKNVEKLSNAYAVSKKDINEATSAFLRYGGATENLAQTQELSIALAKKAGISYEAAGKLLGKASDPENEAQLKRVGIVFQKGSSDAERYNKILEKLTPTMNQLKEQADGPVGSIERFKNSLSGIQSAIGSSLIESLAPILSKLGQAAELVSVKFLPLLKTGLKELSSIITPVTTVLGNAFTFILSVVGDTLTTLGGIIGEAFTQIKVAVSPLTEAIAQIFTAFSQDSTPVFDFAEILKTVLSVVADVATVLIKLLVAPIKLVSEGIAFAITHFDSFLGILDTLSPLIAGVGAALIAYNVAVNFSAITTGALALAQGAYNTVAGFGSTIITGVTAAYNLLANGQVIAAAKTYIFNAAQAALNLVMSANPVGIVVVAIGALVAGLVYAYKNSETFRGVIDNLWKKIKEFLGTVLDAASAVGKFFGLVPDKSEKKIEVKADTKQAETNISLATTALAKYQAEINKAKDYKAVLNIQSKIKVDKGLTADDRAVLQDAIDEKLNTGGLREKANQAAEKAAAARQKEADKAFLNAAKDLANEQKIYEQEIKRNAALEKRSVNESEQLEIQDKKLKTTEKIAKKFKEIYDITTDTKGNVSVGINISKDAKERVINDFEALQTTITESEIELNIKDNKLLEVVKRVRGEVDKLRENATKIQIEVEDKNTEIQLEKIKKQIEEVNKAEYLTALEKSEKLLALEEETQALTTDRRIKALEARKEAEIKTAKETIDKTFNDEDIKLANKEIIRQIDEITLAAKSREEAILKAGAGGSIPPDVQEELNQLSAETNNAVDRLNAQLISKEKIKAEQIKVITDKNNKDIEVLEQKKYDELEKKGKDYTKKLDDNLSTPLKAVNTLFTGFANAFENSFVKSVDVVGNAIDGLQAKLEALTKPKDNKDTLKSIDEEAKKIFESFKKREISGADYFQKMAELEAQRTKASGENADKASTFWLNTQIALVKGFQEASKLSTDILNANLKLNIAKQDEIIKKNKLKTNDAIVSNKEFTEQQTETLTTFVQDASAVAITNFGALVVAGENIGVAFRKTILASMFDIVSKSIDIYIPQILAASIGLLGPIAGLLAGFTAIGVVKGALGAAKSAVTAFRGVVDLQGPGTETSDDIPARLSRRESVLTARATKADGNAELFRWMNNTGGSAIEYFTKVKPDLIQNKLAISAQLEQKRQQLENQKVYFSIALERELEKKDKQSSNELRRIYTKLEQTNTMLERTLEQNDQLIAENKKLHRTFSVKQAFDISGTMSVDTGKIQAEFDKAKVRRLSI